MIRNFLRWYFSALRHPRRVLPPAYPTATELIRIIHSIDGEFRVHQDGSLWLWVRPGSIGTDLDRAIAAHAQEIVDIHKWIAGTEEEWIH